MSRQAIQARIDELCQDLLAYSPCEMEYLDIFCELDALEDILAEGFCDD